MPCSDCGGEEVPVHVPVYHYSESGLDDVYILNGTAYRCTSCNTESGIAFHGLNRLFAYLTAKLIVKSTSLTDDEFTYVRKYSPLPLKNLKALLGSDEHTPTAERVVRMLALVQIARQVQHRSSQHQETSRLFEADPLDLPIVSWYRDAAVAIATFEIRPIPEPMNITMENGEWLTALYA